MMLMMQGVNIARSSIEPLSSLLKEIIFLF